MAAHPHHLSTGRQNALKMIDDIRHVGRKASEMVLQPLTPQRPKLFDDIDSDFSSDEEVDSKESTVTRSPPKQKIEPLNVVPALAGTKRKAGDSGSGAVDDAEKPSAEKKPRVEDGDLKQMKKIETDRKEAGNSNSHRSTKPQATIPAPSEKPPVHTKTTNSSMNGTSHQVNGSSFRQPSTNVIIPSISNHSSTPGALSTSPLTADTASPNSSQPDSQVSVHPQFNQQKKPAKFKDVHENARKMKKSAEKMKNSSKPHHDIVNVRSYAMSLRAGLMFIESAMIAADSGDINSAVRILTEMIKYFEFFASNFIRWNIPKLHMVT
jgi:hypothetical protein